MAHILLEMSSLIPLFCRVSELSRLRDKYFHTQASSKPQQRLGVDADGEVFSEPGGVRFTKKESAFTFLTQETREVRFLLMGKGNSYLRRDRWRANKDCDEAEHGKSAIHQSFP